LWLQSVHTAIGGFLSNSIFNSKKNIPGFVQYIYLANLKQYLLTISMMSDKKTGKMNAIMSSHSFFFLSVIYFISGKPTMYFNMTFKHDYDGHL